MNRLSSEKRATIVGALVEGSSIRSIERMTGVSKTTVMKLLGDLGLVCSIHQDRAMRGLTCERIQCDEIWSFVGAKQRNVRLERRDEGWGDIWVWAAIDADTKIIPSFRVGPRDLQEATAFMHDLAKRLVNRPQLTTDGFPQYIKAVEAAFGGKVDFARMVKVYGNEQNPKKPERRYSPGIVLEANREPVCGNPDPEHISTSFIERQNLTMRMSMRRYTRLTNGFSKKVENHAAAVSLHFMHYNFVRKHRTLGTTPAVAHGIADRPWTVADLIELLTNAEDAVPMKRGPYKKRSA